MTTSNLRILCVDDDDDVSEIISLMLQRSNADYEITSVNSATEAVWLTKTKKFDLYVLDYRYPGMTGIDLCRLIRQRDANTPIIFFTGEAHERERREAMNVGADAYLVKPMDLTKLAETAKQLLGSGRLAARHAARSSDESVGDNAWASARA